MAHGERAARLERWLRNVGGQGTLITTVADPKPQRTGGVVSSAMFGPTTMFTVSTQNINDDSGETWSVERSMGDFTALRSALVQRFPGAVLGHLPESKVTDLAKSKEEKSTKKGEILNHFLRFLCRHPFISQDQVFIAFLSVTSKFTEALRAVAPAAAASSKIKLSRMLSSASRNKRRSLEREIANGLSEEPVSAADWWREAIDLAAEPTDALRLSKDVLGELERIRKKISDLKFNIKDFGEKMKAIGTSCLDLEKSFQSWLAVEYSPDSVAIPTANGEATGKGEAPQTAELVGDGANGMIVVSLSMPVLLGENSNRFHNQGLIHQRMALDAAATLLSAIREEILVLDAMKDEVTAAKDSVLRVEEARLYLGKKEKELLIAEEQARAERGLGALPGDAQGSSSYDDGIDPNFEKKTKAARKAKDDATIALETAIAVASTLCRATLNLELNFFREERIIRSDKFFAEFAKVHADYCARSMDVWTMQPVHGLPNPPVHGSALTSSVPKDRVGRLQTTKSTMTKSGVYESFSSVDDSINSTSGSPRVGDNVVEELIEWGPEIPWDPSLPRQIQIAFDFDPEQEDEVEGKAGERGTAVPFDDERQWLHVKLSNGKSGIIPTDFVRLIAKPAGVPQQAPLNKRPSTTLIVESVDLAEEARSKLKEAEAELAKLRIENDKLKRELDERKSAMDARAAELTSANQAVAQLKSSTKNLQIELDRVTDERDHILSEKDALAQEIQELQQQQRRVAASSSAAASTSSASKASPAIAMQTEVAETDEDLPPNWVKVLDKARNRYFYHNTVTKASVWKKPIEEKQVSHGTKRRQGDQ